MTKEQIKKSIDFSIGPKPDPDDKQLGAFWRYARKEELRFPRCRACGKFHWYPQVLCPYCQSNDIEWAKVSGKGTVFTWTTVKHPFAEEFKLRLPFILTLVTFDDGPGFRFVSNIVQCDPDEIYIGMPVEPVFEHVKDDLVLPVFRPVRRPSTKE